MKVWVSDLRFLRACEYQNASRSPRSSAAFPSVADLLRNGEVPEGRAEDALAEEAPRRHRVGRVVRHPVGRLEDRGGRLPGRLRRAPPGLAEHQLGELGVLVGQRAVVRRPRQAGAARRRRRGKQRRSGNRLWDREDRTL